MLRTVSLSLLCTVATWSSAHAETFVIEAAKAGHEATIKIPAGAVMQLSADSAQTLDGYAGPQIEAMRLTGDVTIGIAGSAEPIQIKADSVVVELVANSTPASSTLTRAGAASIKVLRPTPTGVDSQVFVGNVVFDLETSSGPVEIKADRVEHRLSSEPGA